MSARPYDQEQRYFSEDSAPHMVVTAVPYSPPDFTGFALLCYQTALAHTRARKRWAARLLAARERVALWIAPSLRDDDQ